MALAVRAPTEMPASAPAGSLPTDETATDGGPVACGDELDRDKVPEDVEDVVPKGADDIVVLSGKLGPVSLPPVAKVDMGISMVNTGNVVVLEPESDSRVVPLMIITESSGRDGGVLQSLRRAHKFLYYPLFSTKKAVLFVDAPHASKEAREENAPAICQMRFLVMVL